MVLKYKAFNKDTGAEITDISLKRDGGIFPFASNDDRHYRNTNIVICQVTPYTDSDKKDIYIDDLLVNNTTGFEGVVKMEKGAFVVCFEEAGLIITLDDIAEACSITGNINMAVSSKMDPKSMSISEAYAYIGAGFKDTVYTILNDKIQREVIFSGLSLYDAVVLKNEGNLFNSYDEAKRVLESKNDRIFKQDEEELDTSVVKMR